MVKALSIEQRQAIEEVINIGLGRAATTLSAVANHEVMMTASSLSVSNINTGQALDRIKRSAPDNWVSVSQVVGGDVDAIALAVFSNGNALNVVRSMFSKNGDLSLHDYEPEVMSEIANIILNACIGSISSMMKLNLESYLPVHHIGDCESVLLDSSVLPMKLLMDLDMIVAGKAITGFVSFSVDVASLQKMLQLVAQYQESEAFEWIM